MCATHKHTKLLQQYLRQKDDNDEYEINDRHYCTTEAVSIKAEIKLLKNKNKIVVELSPHFILNLM